jgi:Zn2+/Cd2+-exporting ATPase
MAIFVYVLAFVAGGRETLLHTFADLRRGEVNIDLLMLVAAAGAAALGDWPEGAVLLFLFSLSHALEGYILGRTRRAIAGLMELTPDEATRLRDGQEQRVPVEQLGVGEVVVVRPSERMPVDGVIEEGFTSVDQSPMTGESIPVDKAPGDTVFGGTLNQQGLVHVRVTRIAGETTLARMVQLVEQAQTGRAASQRFTEWFGPRYTWLVLGGSLAYFLLLRVGLDFPSYDAFYRSMAVLVVASPCAVVLSIPAAILTAITSAASGGVLFKGGIHLEDTALLKTMAFDKTGTLTRGRPELVGIATADGVSDEQLLRAAVAIEQHSEHPLARAITHAAKARSIIAKPAEDITSVPGFGVTGTVDGLPLKIGKALWFEQNGPALPSELVRDLEEFRAAGQSVMAVVEGERFLGLLAVADTLRPTAAHAIRELKGLGLAPLLMLTGDSIDVARDFASHLGLEFQAELLPEDKLKHIEQLRREHGAVGMIGDGMNDAPALALANVGFSLGGAGTDVALETADVVIMADDLRRLPYAVTLARRTQQVIRQNLTIAFGVMGTLLVVGLFFELPLPLAVLGHEGSTVLVILNGLRLLAHPRPEPLLQPG